MINDDDSTQARDGGPPPGRVISHHRYWPDGTPLCGGNEIPVRVIPERLAGGDDLICEGCWLEWLRELIERNNGVAPPEDHLYRYVERRGDRIQLRETPLPHPVSTTPRRR